MPTNFPGVRSHGAPQDTEMDVAWQELMAITELQVTIAPNTLAALQKTMLNFTLPIADVDFIITTFYATLSWSFGFNLNKSVIK